MTDKTYWNLPIEYYFVTNAIVKLKSIPIREISANKVGDIAQRIIWTEAPRIRKKKLIEIINSETRESLMSDIGKAPGRRKPVGAGKYARPFITK
jgi:hypothetical protein